MASLVGVERIGGLEFGADGTIRILAASALPAPGWGGESVEDEIARLRSERNSR